eukprot:1068086-Rhodomonas_salina.2
MKAVDACNTLSTASTHPHASDIPTSCVGIPGLQWSAASSSLSKVDKKHELSQREYRLLASDHCLQSLRLSSRIGACDGESEKRFALLRYALEAVGSSAIDTGRRSRAVLADSGVAMLHSTHRGSEGGGVAESDWCSLNLYCADTVVVPFVSTAGLYTLFKFGRVLHRIHAVTPSLESDSRPGPGDGDHSRVCTSPGSTQAQAIARFPANFGI